MRTGLYCLWMSTVFRLLDNYHISVFLCVVYLASWLNKKFLTFEATINLLLFKRCF